MKEHENDFGNFGKQILDIAPQLHPYVKHRLYTAETTGIIPRNMYKVGGVIDDAIITLFEDVHGTIQSNDELKIKLFAMTSKRLDEIIASEEFHKDTLSTSELLSKELERLEEKFEIDLDNDLLMSDELDDISYKQDADKNQMILYDDAEKNIIETLELDDDRAELTDKKRLVLNKIYNWLPLETSNILDLFVFGKLTYDEIALVKGINPDEVKETIRSISKNFRKNLN